MSTRALTRLSVTTLVATLASFVLLAVPAWAQTPPGPVSRAVVGVAPPLDGTYRSLAPARLLDTRAGVGAPKGAVPAGGTVHLQVLGRGGVPASGVSAVVLNVTADEATRSGYLTVYADGGAYPGTSNVNFLAGQSVPNLVIAPVGANGKVALHSTSQGTVRIVADVSGYFVGGEPTLAAPARLVDGRYTSLAPARLLDTRAGVGAPKGAVPAGGTVHLQVLGRGGVPASGVSAVVLNVTADEATRSGYLTVYGDGGAYPQTSNVNFLPGQSVPNLVIAPVGANGKVAIHSTSQGTVRIVADVSGYFTGAVPTLAAPAVQAVEGTYSSLAPARLLDTRAGVGAPKGAVPAGGTVHLQVLGRGGVPASGVSAVVLNVTADEATRSGYLTVYADGGAYPGTSNVNFLAGQSVPNLVIAPVGANGKVAIHSTSQGTVRIVADVSGFMAAAPVITAPGPVTDAQATPTSTSIALTWTNPIDASFTGVMIRRAPGATPPATPFDGTLVTDAAAPTTSFTDTGLTPVTQYSYALFAHNAVPQFAGAATVTATTTPGPLDYLELSPATASITAGESQAYTAEGFDADGNSWGDVTATTTFTVDGEDACPSAVCSPTEAGDHHVTGRNEDAKGKASLHVNAAALDHIVISPPNASITSGESQAYTAEGFDAADNSLGDVTTDTTFTVTSQFTREAGTACPDAVCAPTLVGDYTVTGTDGVATGTASLHVNVGTLHHLVLAPSTATITTGQSKTYTATGFDAAGNTLGDVTATTAFSVDGDNCAAAECAPTAVGNHTVTGTKGTATGTAALHVDPVSVIGYPAYAWGSNSTGQLGDGTTTGRKTPVQAGTGTPWVSATAGEGYTLAVRTDGTLWAWGDNSSGQLGDGTTTNRPAPVQVGSATNWDSVSAGLLHTVAVKTDGTLWAWGLNSSGQLGDGTTTSRSAPVQVGTGTAWASVAAGGTHTVALKTDGTLWTWGDNLRGELGDGTTTNRSTPAQVGTAHWASVAAGQHHTVAIKADHALWAWGWNSLGQVGDGTTINRPSPVQVGTDTDWSSLAVGGTKMHSLAIKTNGTLWAWGFNRDGQVGNGTTTNQTSPVKVGTDTDWASAATGQWHSLAVKTDGTLWAWGNNDSGQLGDGTTTGRLTPVPVAPGFTWVTPVGGYTHSVALGVSAPVCSGSRQTPALAAC